MALFQDALQFLSSQLSAQFLRGLVRDLFQQPADGPQQDADGQKQQHKQQEQRPARSQQTMRPVKKEVLG